jgi:uncharacterized protein
MSEENVEVIRTLWEAYARGDFDRVLALCDPHVVVISLEEGPLYGQEATRRNYERWMDAWEAPEMSVEEITGSGDNVLLKARIRARGRASGAEVDSSFYEVYALRNGKVIRVDEFTDRAAAVEAIGLSE